MWFLLDVIIVLLLALFAFIGMKKGFIKSALGIGITLISSIIAINFHAPLAEYFRSTVVYENLTSNLNATVEKYIGGALENNSFEQLLDNAPSGITAMLSGFGMTTDTVTEKYNELAKSGETHLIEKITDYIVSPAAVALSNALAVFVMFIASLILLNILIKVLDLIFKLPVLNFANKLLGFLFGLVTGLVVVFIFCTAVNIALPYLPGAGIDLTKESASNAMVFTSLSDINPLSFLYR